MNDHMPIGERVARLEAGYDNLAEKWEKFSSSQEVMSSQLNDIHKVFAERKGVAFSVTVMVGVISLVSTIAATVAAWIGLRH